jgi:DHA1 family tetracycline resistance protein-like MFS transporter
MDPKLERRALAVVLTALLIDMIGFGIIMPVMPGLIMDLTHVGLAEAAIAALTNRRGVIAT